MKLYGGIESGGTKWVCAVGTGPDDLRDEARSHFDRMSKAVGRNLTHGDAADLEDKIAMAEKMSRGM